MMLRRDSVEASDHCEWVRRDRRGWPWVDGGGDGEAAWCGGVVRTGKKCLTSPVVSGIVCARLRHDLSVLARNIRLTP